MSKTMSENPDGITINPTEPTNPSTGTTFYCCCVRGGKILYRYNKNGPEMESLAARCLEKAPSHHKWYFHTVGARTFGCLMYDNCTYFAIVEPTMGSTVLHEFLKRVRQIFISVSKKNLENAVAPVIAQFVQTLEQTQGNGGSSVNGDESFHEQEGLVNSQSKRKKREKKDKKKKDEIEMEEIAIVREGEGRERAVRMDVLGSGEDRGIDGGERNRMRQQLSDRRAVWWWHVKIVAAVDVVVCLVLLGIWLVVCQGLKCVR